MLGEAIAARHYERRGYIVLSKNWQPNRSLVAGGEIDLVVARGHELVFIEVKTRMVHGGSIPQPLDAINSAKSLRLSRLASRYLEHNRSALRQWRLRRPRIQGIGITIQLRGWRLPKIVVVESRSILREGPSLG